VDRFDEATEMSKRFLIKSKHYPKGEITCLVILGLILALALVACSGWKNNPKADRSFITDMPCKAPCWYGLELGKSSKADVAVALDELPFIDKASIREYGTRWLDDDYAREYYFGCVHPKKESCGSALISNDKLMTLWLSVGYSLSFKMGVDKLGEPDFLDYGGCVPYTPVCSVSLYWLRKGIVISSDLKNGKVCQAIQKDNSIPADLQVTDIFYTVEDAFGPGTMGCFHRISWPGFSNP
jgi:hypothetical protein